MDFEQQVNEQMERLTVAAQNTVTHWSDLEVRGHLKEHPDFVEHSLTLIEDVTRTVRAAIKKERPACGNVASGEPSRDFEDQVATYRAHTCDCDHCYQQEPITGPEHIYESFTSPAPHPEAAVNTCRLTINYHRDTDQCGEHMVNHTVHIDPINVDLPTWITRDATHNMCADRNGDHDHWLPNMRPVTEAMTAQGIDVVVILGDERRTIERELCDDGGHSYIADVITRGFDDVEGYTAEDTAVVFDLANDLIIVTTPKLAWDAK